MKKFNIPSKCIVKEISEATSEIVAFAKGARAAKALNNAVIGLIGPRQTFRFTGPQDITIEEWEITRKFGITIVHIEMSEVLELAEQITFEEAERVSEALGIKKGDLRIKADHEIFLKSIRVYLAIKKIFEKYKLDMASAECYPAFSGVCNLAASLLADEGIYVDTEGDVLHTLLMYVLGNISNDKPAILAEIVDLAEDKITYAHEGSSAMSLAQKSDEVAVLESAEGLMVGFPVAPMPAATLCTISGQHEDFKIFISKAIIEKPSKELWEKNLCRFLAIAKPECGSETFTNKIIDFGVDHHCVIKPGFHIAEIEMLCQIIGIELVKI